jgi:DNA primase
MSKSLVEVLIEQGIKLEDSSSNRKVAICPFHEGDRDPSFTVYPTNTYFCFGCDAWGDALKFLVDYKGWEFRQAMEYLGDDYTVRKSDKPEVVKVKNTSNTYKFLHGVAEDYHRYLMETPGALRYLYSRGITEETIQHYKLGYTDGNVLNLQWAWEQQLAREAGVMNVQGYEVLSHRITLPNLTETGYCDFIMGRTVTNDNIKYLGIRVPKPLHGFYEVRHSPVIFLAEGHFDWLVLRQWGYPAAILGGSHLSRHNALLLKDKRIVIVPDFDVDASKGEATAKRIQSLFGENAEILDYSELRTGPGKLDVAALAESAGGERLFKIIVMEQLPWLQMLSPRIVQRWFPMLQPLHI